MAHLNADLLSEKATKVDFGNFTKIKWIAPITGFGNVTLEQFLSPTSRFGALKKKNGSRQLRDLGMSR